MIAASLDLGVVAHDWLAALFRASWQGAIAIGVVWCLCRGVRSIPPWARCWMWRLVLVKVLLVAVWPGTIDLPWLPLPQADPPAVAHLGPGIVPAGMDQDRPVPPAAGREPTVAGSDAAPPSSSLLTFADRGGLVRAVLLAMWVSGVVGAAAVLLTRIRTARRWRKACVLVKDAAILSLGEKLAAEFRLANPPLLLIGESCESPVVFGALRTCIVLPASLVQEVSLERLRMILGHEMAHIRRGDLLWNWLATGVWGMFFFHPLVWIALRELRLNQELACDACAVASRETSVADYGTLLVELADRNRAAPNLLVTVGVVESFECLKRRLKAMRNLQDHSPWMKPLSVGLLTAMLVGLLPWRLVAQAPRGENAVAVRAVASRKPVTVAKEKMAPVDEDAKRDAVATISVGKYQICIDEVRWVGGKGIAMVDTGFPFSMDFDTRETRNVGPGFETRTMTRTGSGGFGGSFVRPNLVVDLRVEGPKGQGNQLLCAVVGKVQAADDRGRRLEAPETPSWMKLELPGVEYPQASGCTAVHLNIADKNTEALSLLEGRLLVADAKMRTTVFEQDEFDRKPTHRLKGVTVRLSDVSIADNGTTVTLDVSPPDNARVSDDPLESMHNMRDTHARVRAVLVGSDGNTYRHQGSGGSGGGYAGGGYTGRSWGGGWTSGGSTGGGYSSTPFSFSGRSGDGRGGSRGRSATVSQSFNFPPLPEGVKIKNLTCTVIDLVGKPQSLAFKFRDLPVP